MSLKFPHDGWTLLPLVSREKDSPRCAGARAGVANVIAGAIAIHPVTFKV